MKKKDEPNFVDEIGTGWDGYSTLRQGKMPNALASTTKKRLKPVSHLARIKQGDYHDMYYAYDNHSFDVTIGLTDKNDYEDYNTIAKVKPLIEMVFAQQVCQDIAQKDIDKASEIHLYIDDYMAATGINKKDYAKMNIEKAMHVLATVRSVWTETTYLRNEDGTKKFKTVIDKKTRKRKTVPAVEEHCYAGAYIGTIELDKKAESQGIYKPIIKKDSHGREFYTCWLNKQMAQYMAYCPVMPFYRDLLKIDFNKYRNSLIFGTKLLAYWNMNRHNANRNPQLLENEWVVKVENLLIDSDLPLYEELTRTKKRKLPNGEYRIYEEKGNSWTEKIREPFERDLNILVEIQMLKSWCYCDVKGDPLLGKITDYAAFAGLYIKYAIDKHEIDNSDKE